MRREGARPLRVVHGFEEVSGQVAAMAAAQRTCGTDASALIFRPHLFGYEGATGEGQLRTRLKAIWKSLFEADVVHLYFGTSLFTVNRLPDHELDGAAPAARARRALSRLLWMRDLPLLKALGKTIAMTFLGDDVRQVGPLRSRGRASHLDGPYGDGLARYDERKRRLAALAERYADLIYVTNPDLLDVVSGRARFLSYVRPGISLRPQEFRDRPPLRVAHAPSNPAVKGTADVEDAIRQLRDAGHDLRYDLITNASHAEALERLAKAHVFVDQLRVGWYGVAATEALSLGCVTLTYLDGGDLGRIPAEMAATMPIGNVDAASLAAAIAAIDKADRSVLAERSARGCEWVERWHGAKPTAEAVLEDYRRARGRGR